ncbi:hypothetical protein Goarm_016554 [Gossypium armourianum]|uniref:Uncharacterized protein n=1 Tax=Gossypium armourianum TaxID=34283 RepID=A0A7J9JCZ3_9ROSI|nr:hypothetical protein [Gossypium armourianum]
MRSKLFLSSRKDLLTMETLLHGQLKKIAAGGEVLSVNRAGHIIRLDLHPVFSHADHDDFTWTPMDGVISSSLLDLRHLSHLDLSRNQFTKIPGFVGVP